MFAEFTLSAADRTQPGSGARTVLVSPAYVMAILAALERTGDGAGECYLVLLGGLSYRVTCDCDAAKARLLAVG